MQFVNIFTTTQIKTKQNKLLYSESLLLKNLYAQMLSFILLKNIKKRMLGLLCSQIAQKYFKLTTSPKLWDWQKKLICREKPNKNINSLL